MRRSSGSSRRRARPSRGGRNGCGGRRATVSPRRSPRSTKPWRCTAVTAGSARRAGRRSSASCTPATRPTTAPPCQTGGRLLADRSLSRLLGSDWPRSLYELDQLTASPASVSTALHLTRGIEGGPRRPPRPRPVQPRATGPGGGTGAPGVSSIPADRTQPPGGPSARDGAPTAGAGGGCQPGDHAMRLLLASLPLAVSGALVVAAPRRPVRCAVASIGCPSTRRSRRTGRSRWSCRRGGYRISAGPDDRIRLRWSVRRQSQLSEVEAYADVDGAEATVVMDGPRQRLSRRRRGAGAIGPSPSAVGRRADGRGHRGRQGHPSPRGRGSCRRWKPPRPTGGSGPPSGPGSCGAEPFRRRDGEASFDRSTGAATGEHDTASESQGRRASALLEVGAG